MTKTTKIAAVAAIAAALLLGVAVLADGSSPPIDGPPVPTTPAGPAGPIDLPASQGGTPRPPRSGGYGSSSGGWTTPATGR